MSLDRLHRKLRFAPKMGGNREMVTLPCSFVSQLIGLALWRIDPDKETEAARLDVQAAELLKEPLKITTENEGTK